MLPKRLARLTKALIYLAWVFGDGRSKDLLRDLLEGNKLLSGQFWENA